MACTFFHEIVGTEKSGKLVRQDDVGLLFRHALLHHAEEHRPDHRLELREHDGHSRIDGVHAVTEMQVHGGMALPRAAGGDIARRTQVHVCPVGCGSQRLDEADDSRRYQGRRDHRQEQ